jgi:hypothetical protein
MPALRAPVLVVAGECIDPSLGVLGFAQDSAATG